MADTRKIKTNSGESVCDQFLKSLAKCLPGKVLKNLYVGNFLDEGTGSQNFGKFV